MGDPNVTKVAALKKLMRKISSNTGKKWPNLNNKIMASGANGIIIRTRNDPNKVVKVARGNVEMTEIKALKTLKDSGFVPRLNGNFVHLTRLNRNVKNTLFPGSTNSWATVYAMQRVGNATLWRYVKTGHNSNNNKRQIRSAIRNAIKFMHSKGISHGNLHSGNILVELGPNGKMKKLWVIDFGRAVNFDPKHFTENSYYNKLLSVNSTYNNYNLFNASKKPQTTLYNYNGAGSRKNRELYVKMYGGNNSNFK